MCMGSCVYVCMCMYICVRTSRPRGPGCGGRRGRRACTHAYSPPPPMPVSFMSRWLEGDLSRARAMRRDARVRASRTHACNTHNARTHARMRTCVHASRTHACMHACMRHARTHAHAQTVCPRTARTGTCTHACTHVTAPRGPGCGGRRGRCAGWRRPRRRAAGPAAPPAPPPPAAAGWGPRDRVDFESLVGRPYSSISIDLCL
jgi:hypothetical protein